MRWSCNRTQLLGIKRSLAERIYENRSVYSKTSSCQGIPELSAIQILSWPQTYGICDLDISEEVCYRHDERHGFLGDSLAIRSNRLERHVRMSPIHTYCKNRNEN